MFRFPQNIYNLLPNNLQSQVVPCLIHLERATRNKSSELRIAAGSGNFIISAEIMNGQSPVTRIANFSYRIFNGPERNDVINLTRWHKDVLE